MKNINKDIEKEFSSVIFGKESLYKRVCLYTFNIIIFNKGGMYDTIGSAVENLIKHNNGKHTVENF